MLRVGQGDVWGAADARKYLGGFPGAGGCWKGRTMAAHTVKSAPSLPEQALPGVGDISVPPGRKHRVPRSAGMTTQPDPG